MKLQKLTLFNITSFRGQHVLDFEKDLRGQGLFAITGPTGSGKSSLLNAITLALYGKHHKKEIHSSDILTQGEFKGSVELIFSLGVREFTAKWSCETHTVKGKLRKTPLVSRELLQEGLPADQTIEELLGQNFEQFGQTVILHQGEFAKFLKSTYAKRRELLERLMQNPYISRVSDHIRNESGQLDQEMQKILKALSRQWPDKTEVKSLETQIAFSTELISSLEKLKKIQADVLRLEHQQDLLETKRKKSEQFQEEAQVLIKSLNKEKAELEENCNFSSLVQAIEKLKNEVERERKSRKKLDGLRALLNEEVQTLKNAEKERDSLLLSERETRPKLEEFNQKKVLLEKDLYSLEERKGLGPSPQAQAVLNQFNDAESLLNKEKEKYLEETSKDLVARVYQDSVSVGHCLVCTGSLPKNAPPLAKNLETTKRNLLTLQKGFDISMDSFNAFLKSLRKEIAETERRRVLTDSALKHISLALTENSQKIKELESSITEKKSLLKRELPPKENETATSEEKLISLQRNLYQGQTKKKNIEEQLRSQELRAQKIESDLDLIRSNLRQNNKTYKEHENQKRSLEQSIKTLLSSEEEMDTSETQRLLLELSERLGRDRNQLLFVKRELSLKNQLESEKGPLQQRWNSYEKFLGLVKRDEFRQFCLTRFEQELLEQANSELCEICEGRYRLAQIKRGTSIDYAVIDRWNADSLRKAATLSGGESFLVSLALSLALSTLNSSGVNSLGPFFIDEGFGTLDPQAIEDALEVLKGIEAPGRQIGIITHVQTLADHIPARIEIGKREKKKIHIRTGPRA